MKNFLQASLPLALLFSSAVASAEPSKLSDQAIKVIEYLKASEIKHSVMYNDSPATENQESIRQNVIIIGTNDGKLELPGQLPTFYFKGERPDNVRTNVYIKKGLIALGLTLVTGVGGIPYLIYDTIGHRYFDLDDSANSFSATLLPAAVESSRSEADDAFAQTRRKKIGFQSPEFEKELIIILNKNSFTRFKAKMSLAGYKISH